MLKKHVKSLLPLVFPGKFIFHGPRGKRIALTFDDGPHPVNTPKILRVLDAHQVRATFFVSGDAAERHPGILADIHAAGHELANHGYVHQRMSMIGYRAYADGLRKTAELIRSVTGVSPKYFRPPFGELTIGTIRCTVMGKSTCVLWTRDSRDSFISEAIQLKAYLSAQPFNGGEIILVHDDQHQTAEMLPGLLSLFASVELSSVTVSQLMNGI